MWVTKNRRSHADVVIGCLPRPRPQAVGTARFRTFAPVMYLQSTDVGAAYRQSSAEVLAAFHSDADRGLDEGEARARLERYGRNELAATPPPPAWMRFAAQFRDLLVILLLIATAISAALWLHERDAALPYEAIPIFAVVLLNAVMGYVQESR